MRRKKKGETNNIDWPVEGPEPAKEPEKERSEGQQDRQKSVDHKC